VSAEGGAEEAVAKKAVNKLLGWVAVALLTGGSVGGGIATKVGSSGLEAQIKELKTDMKADMKDLQQQIRGVSDSRWTKPDHAAYAAGVQKAFDRQDARMDRIERDQDKRGGK